MVLRQPSIIESAAGTAAGGKTGLTATLVGVLFLLMIFLSPLSYLVPAYATAPALMYVGLLMLGNVTKLDFNDSVDALSGMLCAVFIVLTCNIVTGIMLGFVAWWSAACLPPSGRSSTSAPSSSPWPW